MQTASDFEAQGNLLLICVNAKASGRLLACLKEKDCVDFIGIPNL